MHPRRWSGDTHDDLGGSIREAETDALMAEAAELIDTLRAQLEAAERWAAHQGALRMAAEARAEAAEAECARLLTALGTVADWDLPETGETWPSGGPVSFEAQYGSNGARDYMRAVARKAIDAARTKEQQA